jgi:hypothetical protein
MQCVLCCCNQRIFKQYVDKFYISTCYSYLMGALSHNGYSLIEIYSLYGKLRTCRCINHKLVKLLHTWDTKFLHFFDVTLLWRLLWQIKWVNCHARIRPWAHDISKTVVPKGYCANLKRSVDTYQYWLLWSLLIFVIKTMMFVYNYRGKSLDGNMLVSYNVGMSN